MILIENIAKLMNAYFEGRGGQNYSVARIRNSSKRVYFISLLCKNIATILSKSINSSDIMFFTG